MRARDRERADEAWRRRLEALRPLHDDRAVVLDPFVDATFREGDAETQVARVREILAYLGADAPGEEVWKRIRGLLDPGATRLNFEETYRLIPNADEIDATFGGEQDGRLFSD